MSTQPHTQQSASARSDAMSEDFTGLFGFFRKYQKAILYTAGLFALVTFSITGAMMGFFSNIFDSRGQMPTIEVGGRTVDLTAEDYLVGQMLSRRVPAHQPTQVMPQLSTGEGSESDLQDMLAILRRAAIAEGLDVSDFEVDAAIDSAVRGTNHQLRQRGETIPLTATDLALRVGLGSLAQYRYFVKEAMRIGNYVRLQALVADGSDAAAMAQVIKDKEKVTLRVATLDAKALEEQLKAGSELTDENLQKFLDEMAEQDKRMHQLYDTNRVSLQLGALVLAEFDPSQWTEELTELGEPGEDLLRALYEQEKDPRFKVDPDKWREAGGQDPIPLHQPFEKEEVQAELKQLAQAEQVMGKLHLKLRDGRSKALEEPNAALRQSNEDRGRAEGAVQEAKMALEADAENQELQDALTAKQAELEEKKVAFDTADKALQAAREAFDFPAAFAAATVDKTGCRLVEVPGPKNADDLKELPELGSWKNPWLGVNVPNQGDLGATFGRAEKGVFVFKVTQLEKQPLKPFDTIKEKLSDVYWIGQAKEQAETRKKVMEDALLRLGRERIPDKVQELESARQTRIDERIATWETDLQTRIARAEDKVKNNTPGTRTHREWQAELDRVRTELAGKAEKVTEVATAVGEDLEKELEAEARKHFGEVLEAAATEAGFTVVTLGPYRRDLPSTDPRFSHREDKTLEFVWRGHVSEIKEGEATAVVEDPTNRRWHLAVCDKVEPITVADVTRREFQQVREAWWGSFRGQRVLQTESQAFELKALKARYAFQSRQTEPPVAGPEKKQ